MNGWILPLPAVSAKERGGPQAAPLGTSAEESSYFFFFFCLHFWVLVAVSD